MLTIRQLRYLDALVRCQHFGRAARGNAAVSQPALSIAESAKLEEFLGIELFERRPGRAGPHRNRDRDRPAAPEPFLARLAILVDSGTADRSKLLSGTLRLGIIPDAGALIYCRMFCHGFREKHPDLKPRFYLGKRKPRTLLAETEPRRARLDVLLMALPG